MEYEFKLKFKRAADDLSDDDVMTRLANAGCTDALVGLGTKGYIGLEFIREAEDVSEAIASALADVQQALPAVVLVEAGPDYVGLTEVADLVGMSRQNMRKLFVKNALDFPPPVHGGSSTVWHLAPILEFLRDREYPFAQSVFEVAQTAMQLNIEKERVFSGSRLNEKIRQRLTA